MKIALIGYGKMGKTIEQIAIARGHEIVARIDIDNQQDFESEEFDSLIEMLLNKNYDITKLPLIEYTYVINNKKTRGIALNEVTLVSYDKTMVMEIDVNSKLLEKFRGNGVVVSTPSGSTAYNKSLGGAVVDASLEAFQMTEIAAINSKIYHTLSSPLVLSKKHEIKLMSEGKSTIWITVDSKSLNIKNFESLTVTLSDRKIKYCKSKESFVHRLTKSFI